MQSCFVSQMYDIDSRPDWYAPCMARRETEAGLAAKAFSHLQNESIIEGAEVYLRL